MTPGTRVRLLCGLLAWSHRENGNSPEQAQTRGLSMRLEIATYYRSGYVGE